MAYYLASWKAKTIAMSLAIAVLGGGVLADGATPGFAAERERGSEPFGLSPYIAPEGPLWVRWRALQSDIGRDEDILAACRAEPVRCPQASAARFLRIIDEARAHEGRARLETVNRGVNTAIRWVDDLTQYGMPELWTSPLNTFTAGRGDCMDYSIAKYVALLKADVSADDLRILLVWDGSVRRHHAVLAARHEQHWLILDNRSMMLGEDVDLKTYIPLFAIDNQGVRQFQPPSSPFRIIDKLDNAWAPCGSAPH